MVDLPRKLTEKLCSLLGGQITEVSRVSGGDISESFIVVSSAGNRAFVKCHKSAPSGFFEAEARGLEELNLRGGVTTPKVLFVGKAAEEMFPCIVLEALELGLKSSAGEVELAQLLAKMHRCSASKYGFETDNFIGLTPQRNTWELDWGTFFWQHRLVMQADLGKRSGWFDARLEKLLRDKEKTIRTKLSQNSEAPSLLHGDLWSGNVFWSDGGPVFIDPAVYYGSREADLAFTELFGGFSRAFYQAYEVEFPLQPGYEDRREILNLYHLMNHANLFGGHYVDSVSAHLNSIR